MRLAAFLLLSLIAGAVPIPGQRSLSLITSCFFRSGRPGLIIRRRR